MLTKSVFIWFKKNSKNSNIVKYYCNLKQFYLNMFENIFFFCDAQLNFQHHYSSLQKSFSYTDLLLKKHFWLFSVL